MIGSHEVSAKRTASKRFYESPASIAGCGVLSEELEGKKKDQNNDGYITTLEIYSSIRMSIFPASLEGGRLRALRGG
jgi:hypothetical protein